MKRLSLLVYLQTWPFMIQRTCQPADQKPSLLAGGTNKKPSNKPKSGILGPSSIAAHHHLNDLTSSSSIASSKSPSPVANVHAPATTPPTFDHNQQHEGQSGADASSIFYHHHGTADHHWLYDAPNGHHHHHGYGGQAGHHEGSYENGMESGEHHQQAFYSHGVYAAATWYNPPAAGHYN